MRTRVIDGRIFLRLQLTPTEARTLLEAAKGERFEALYVLAITAGLRRGELLGLRWTDVDLERGYVQVRQ